MRLRSNCTSQKRTTHRALRMALAMALVGGPISARAADALAPACASSLNSPAHAEAGLLPYPFGPDCRDSQAQRTENLHRLVRLVGLQHKSSATTRSANVSQFAQPTLPSVVAASAIAVENAALSSEASNAAGLSTAAHLPRFPQAAQLAMPVAPSLPGLTTPVTLPAVQPSLAVSPRGSSQSSLPMSAVAVEAESLVDSLYESLIDIEIPLDVVQGAPASKATGPAEVARHDLPSTGAQVSARGTSAGLVQATLPPQLMSAASESIASPNGTLHGASTGVTTALGGRRPELVQARKSMSVTQPIASSPSVNLSLSDSQTATSTSSRAAASNNASAVTPSMGDRSVSLHLSSASQTPLKTSPVPIQFPQRAPGMQVRVEGEPAPLMTARDVRSSDGALSALPRPSMESTTHVVSNVRAEQSNSGKKVKASFASRTTQLSDRESLAVAESRGLNARQPGGTLSVGLQESQALSAEFPIVELSVEHPAICQLMQTGENSVSLIGMRPGSTRIALITVDEGGERQVEVHEVSVGTSAKTELSLPDLAKEISRTVAKMVPHSDVQIVAYSDYLLVHGFTPYESDAKKILALVRKTSLIPVVDQLKTNER